MLPSGLNVTIRGGNGMKLFTIKSSMVRQNKLGHFLLCMFSGWSNEKCIFEILFIIEGTTEKFTNLFKDWMRLAIWH